MGARTVLSSCSSRTSSEQVATTAAALRRRSRSVVARSTGLESAGPWCRRFTTPSAWNVCTTGMPSGPAARSDAQPDIQKWACTTSGRHPSSCQVLASQ